jgi:hypothetical protein
MQSRPETIAAVSRPYSAHQTSIPPRTANTLKLSSSGSAREVEEKNRGWQKSGSTPGKPFPKISVRIVTAEKRQTALPPASAVCPGGHDGSMLEPPSIPTLADAGVDKKLSVRAQKLAAVLRRAIERVIRKVLLTH